MKPVTAFFFTLAALALLAAGIVSAEEVEWDQERVATLAQDLIPPVELLRADLAKRPAVPEKEAARAVVANDLDRLHSTASELAQRLAKGASRAETVALFREVEAVQRQAAKHAQEYPALFEVHIQVDRLQNLMSQLAVYYAEASPKHRDPSP